MKQKSFWLQTLNVRSDEVWLVKKLFLLQFFQGAGISFFFTAAFALFLDRFEITELPYVFIYSSFLLWTIGFLYSKLEHKVKISNLAIIITIFISVSILLFRLAFGLRQSVHFLYPMLAWFNVLYLLNNLEFWGIASLCFDLQQSKRLFGVISAGDIPAKFIGYSLALLTVEYIGTINLLWASAVCMLASLPFLISIKQSGKLHDAHHDHGHVKQHAQPVGKLVKNFSGNILIRRLAVLSIIITTGAIVINYAFYAGVKSAFHTDVALAKFIAFFLAFVRIIALIVKTIATSRLINRLGIIKSLLITPVVMLVLVAVILLTQNMPANQQIIVYFFGVTSILVDILRSAINSPVFLILMQPLSSHERLRAHTIVKGIMDPFASLIAGLVLLVLIHYHEKVDLLAIGYFLLVIAIGWIVSIYLVNNQYLKTIIQTISRQYFNKENFTINDSSTLDWLREKIKSGTETEVCNILSMLDSGTNKMADELLLLALQHPSEKVKVQALQLVRKGGLPVTETLLPLLKTEGNPTIIAETIGALSRTGIDSAIIVPYLDSFDIKIREAAISGLLKYDNAESKSNAENRLQQMLYSDITSERKMVATILGNQENFTQAAMLLQLMKDKEREVRKEAILAIGKTGNEELLKELITTIAINENDVISALFVAGENSLPVIDDFLRENKIKQSQKEKLILLCGRIGGKKAQALLFDMLHTQNSQTKEYRVVIRALYRSKYIIEPKQQPIFISASKELLEQSAALLYMQNRLQQHGKKYQLLINSFEMELTELRESLLYIFALLYDRQNIKKVKSAYATGKKENITNAMEIIDITVRKDLAVQFNNIFEPGDIAERIHSLRKIYPSDFFETIEHLLNRILAQEKQTHHYWTLACSLYTAKKQHHSVNQDLIKRYTLADNLLLRETAEFAL